jgi:hypothetical protein
MQFLHTTSLLKAVHVIIIICMFQVLAQLNVLAQSEKTAETLVHLQSELKISKIASSRKQLLVLSSNGRVFDWVIDKSNNENNQFSLLQFPEDELVVDICCGTHHHAAITSSGLLYTWGRNAFGELAHGDLIARPKPVKVIHTLNSPVVRVACGDYHTIVLYFDGIIQAAGQNQHGQLGVEAKLNTHLITISPFGKARFKDISARSNYSIAITNEDVNRIILWGDDKMLGISARKNLSETDASYFISVLAVDDGILALSSTGDIISWGLNGSKVLESSIDTGKSIIAFSEEKLIELSYGKFSFEKQATFDIKLVNNSIVGWRAPFSPRSQKRSIQSILCNGISSTDTTACGSLSQGNCTATNACTCTSDGLAPIINTGSTPTTYSNCGPIISTISPVNVWGSDTSQASITITASNLVWDNSNPTLTNPICRFTVVMADPTSGNPIQTESNPCTFPATSYFTCSCKVPDMPNTGSDTMIFVDVSNDGMTLLHWSLAAFDQYGNTQFWDDRRFFILYHNATTVQKNLACNTVYNTVTADMFATSSAATLLFTGGAPTLDGQPKPLFSTNNPTMTTVYYGLSKQATLLQFSSSFTAAKDGQRNAVVLTNINPTGAQLINNRTAFVEFALSNDTSTVPPIGNVIEIGLYSSEGHMIFASLVQNYSAITGSMQYSISTGAT